MTKQLITEGGNVFKAPDWSRDNPQMLTDRINKGEVPTTVKFLNKLTGMRLENNLLGSTGIAETSGDIDIAIDMNEVSKDQLIATLVDKGVSTDHIRKTGDSVHYMCPIFAGKKRTDRFVQVDFMFVPSVEFAVWSMRTAPESTYKGVYLQKLRADLTNTVAPKDAQGKSQWKWNHFKGVLNRSDDSPVFGEFDPDAIAKGLLGPSATRRDLESVEGIMRLLKDNERRKEVIDTYRQTLARDPKGTQLPPDEQLNRDYLEEATYNSKSELINDFLKRGKTAAQGAAAWERGYRGRDSSSFKKKKSPQPQQKFWWQDKEDVQLTELKVGQATKRLMAQQKQDKKQSQVGREFQHIEDLVYIEGISGVKRALLRLAQIAKNSKPLEVKWDGSPAIIFGRDENGTFHFGDKYAKQMLSNPREVYEYYTRSSQTDSRKQFALEMAELCPVYAAATPKNFRGFVEAGLMYKKTPPQNERGEYYFTPNTVTYFVDSGSALGERISRSVSGAAATGTFDRLPELGGQRRPVGDVYKHITGDQVVIIPPKFTDTATEVDVDKLRTISRFAASVAQPLEAFIAPEQGLSDIRAIIYRYVNSQVDDPRNLHNLGHNFTEWLQTSGVVSQPKQEKILNRIKTNQRGANAVFKLVQAIMHIKDDIIGQKEETTLGSLGIRAQLAKTGEHGGEGFVHDPESGVGPTKLVNRGTFTRANRLRESVERFMTEQVSITSETAVVGWGRGMGHRGHMYLASAVITEAEEKNADPYFFVSETVGQDDPLMPQEKLSIYKKVFPEHGDMFQTARTIIEPLQTLHDAGYRNLIFVVGADQKQSFQFLARPTSSGTLPVQFDHVKVISRQETNDPYANEEGPRATPMREILTNPDATTEQKFEMWRRDMPKALSDDEVLHYMKLAAKRMGAPIE